jgi:hypothetical protein
VIITVPHSVEDQLSATAEGSDLIFTPNLIGNSALPYNLKLRLEFTL